MSTALVFLISLVLSLSLLGENHSSGPRTDGTSRAGTQSDKKNEDWCHGYLSNDEKAAIQNELAAIYSRYKDKPEDLQKGIDRLVTQHSGSGGLRQGAAVTAQVMNSASKLGAINIYTKAMDALSRGEEPKDSKTLQMMKTIKSDFQKLTSFGLRYDGKNGLWDFSGIADKQLDLKSLGPSLKEAFKNLLSPEIAEKFFDPDRKDAFTVGDYIVRPPGAGFRVVSQQTQDEAVKSSLDGFAKHKEEYLAASRESNTYSNSMSGRFWEMLGYERGSNGETGPENDRRTAMENMERRLNFMRGTLGVKMDVLNPVYSSLQKAITQDSDSLAALDRDLTQKINTLKTAQKALYVAAISVATAGVFAPAALATVIGASGTGMLASSVVGTAMAVPLVLQATVGTVNAGIESARSGTSFSCAMADELYNRGPGAVAGSAMAAAFVTGSAALAPGGAAVAAAETGVGLYFTAQGVKGLIQSGADLKRVLDEAEKAEAEGNTELAYRLRTQAMKAGTDLVANGVMEAQGLRNLYKGYQNFKQKQANQAESLLGRPLTKKQRQAIEDAHRIGDGELGADGSPAGRGNYTADQKQAKYNRLAEEGIPKADIKLLMDAGIVGAPPNWGKKTSQEASQELTNMARKTGKDSADPVAVVRDDGAPIYRVNPKHVADTPQYRAARSKEPGIIPENHVALYRNAIKGKNGDYWAKDSNGNLHRFQVDNNNEAHWNGATQLKKPGKPNSQHETRENPKPINWEKDVPPDILKAFGY